MVLPPGCYEATIKDKVDKQKETNHIPKQDGFLYHVMRNKPPLPSEEISYDPYTIPQNLTPLVYGEASAGMHLSNISLQTGEEFAWQFSQEASQIQKAFSVEKVLASKGNFSTSKWSNPNAYEDITSIHGVGQINSGGDLEKSFTGVEQSSSKNSEGTFSSGLIESTQSFKNEGWHSHSDLQAPFQQVSHASTHRSSFSEQSKVSSLSKVKFMCSFGGKILPRPSDGRLRYVGGETHLVSVNRDINYDSLMHKALRIYGQGLILKYQLPGEGLDALVSVSCDEDVENMMEEYQKMANSNENFKLRIFLFDSLGHDFGHFNILADKKVSEQLYVNAVNGIPDSAQEKLAECIGTMTSQCAENQNGLQFAVEQYENQVEPVLWDSSLQKRPRGTEEIIPREESCTKIKMPVSANPYGSSSLSSTCFPFISPAVEDFQVSAVPMSVLPVDTVHSALQSGTQFNYPHDLFSNHFRTSGQEEKISSDEQGMSKDILVNQHLDSLIRSFSETGQEGDQKVTDTNISRHVLDNMKMQLQDEFEHKQCTLDPTLRDFTSDWTCVSQVSDTVHGQLHQHIMDRSLYGVFHAAYTPISCGVTQQSSVEQDISQALYHNKEPHLTNHECGESLTFEIGQPSHIESLGVLQPINLVVNDNSEQSNFNQKSSSTPSQNFVEDLTNARLSEDVSIANEEPSGQKENNDEWSSRGFVSLASNQSSEHSSEQTQSLENYEKQYSQRIQEAQTHCQQVLPHVKSDTVLQAHIKSAEEMSKSNNVSQGRHSESSLGIMPSQNALHSSQKPLPQVQNFEDADNESTFTSSTSSGNQPLFPQPLCKHKNRTNLEESSSIHSYFSEPAQSGLSLQEGRDSEVNYVKSTRTCQSEGEGDERISDLLWGSDADPPVSFSRIKSSGDIDTFISSSLEEPFQTFQTYGNAGHQKVHVPSENKEIKDVPNYKSVKIKDEPDNILQESAANFCSMDFLSDSSVQTGEANDNNLVSTSSNLSLPLADGEDHSTSCTSEKWWAETVLKSSSCNHDADVNTSGRRKSSSNVAGDDLNTHLYEGIPLFGKSLMDEDIVEAYKVSGVSVPKIEGFQDSCSDSLVVNAANDPSYQNADFPTNENSISGFSLNGSITKAAMGGIDVHGNFDAESNGPVQSLTDSMACSVNLTFTATSSTAEHDWELLRKNARVKVDISTGIGSEIMGEESIAIQDLDIEESKIEYSDKDDEPDSDAAIAESEAIARGLQIIKNGDLEELRELGCGTFGTVLYGKWRGSDVAIKRIKNSIFIGTPSMQDRLRVDFWREACILSQLHHPNVLAFYGVVPDGPGGTLATVTEYMVNGSLKQVLQRKDRPLDRRKRWLITMDAAFGMEYLHSKNIVHFDLKCENLLVNMRDSQRPICKVGDLGLSKVKQHTLVSGGVRGTLPWMAPELLNGSSCMVSEKVDVFSFGIVMWELLTGEEPYANMHYGAIIGGIVSNTLRPSVPSWCDPAWRTLMEQCWSADPAERPSFTEIANRLRSTAQSFHSKAQHSHAQVYHS